MKRLFIILFLLIANPCFAEKYLLFIEKHGKVTKGEESGHNEKGDVVGVTPYKGNLPVEYYNGSYDVKIVNTTQDKIELLTAPETEEVYDEDEDAVVKKVKKARKIKVKIDEISSNENQEITEYELLQKSVNKITLVPLSND